MAVEPKKTGMPKQKPEERIKNFFEVALGYSEEMALREAKRCLQCKKPVCIDGCPVEIDIPAFIKLIKDKDYNSAIKKIKEKNSLPAICGRVCPQEEQCELKCVLGKKMEPVGIGRLERFAADWEKSSGLIESNIVEIPKEKIAKIAVVGSGPAGLTCAGDLAKYGYDVTIFESLHLAGGVLRYGIPEFRLPKEILDIEINYLIKLGVQIMTNVLIGKTITIPELFNDGFKAVFIGTGAGLPSFLGVPGENLSGVYSANEYLTRVNLMEAYKFPETDTPVKIGKKVAVVGAGNVAMDSARVSLRLGAEEVYIVYRRSEQEMPARKEEIENAKEEGIKFHLLTNPVEVIGDSETGKVKAMKCIKNKLGEPDSSGRRRPVPIPDSEYVMEIDTIISAIGQAPNPLVPQSMPELKLGSHGNIITDEVTGETSMPNVYAGGDMATGAATVIAAMGAGKRAARAINEKLK
ncbi:MAG: NADPH-dependent glutamate synthase [Candidatus Firestonebacteria bacterium]